VSKAHSEDPENRDNQANLASPESMVLQFLAKRDQEDCLDQLELRANPDLLLLPVSLAHSVLLVLQACRASLALPDHWAVLDYAASLAQTPSIVRARLALGSKCSGSTRRRHQQVTSNRHQFPVLREREDMLVLVLCQRRQLQFQHQLLQRQPQLLRTLLLLLLLLLLHTLRLRLLLLRVSLCLD